MLTPRHPILTVSDAHLAYGKVRALQGVSLELFEGELLGLLGPNGAGKSSLIRCLAGRQRLQSGRIQIHCEAGTSAIGVVPQDIAIYSDLTVQQNLNAFGRLHGVPRDELSERAEHALQWAALEDKQRAMAGTLSGGMQRRLNIACSVLHDPSILLLDEPTVGVDPQSRERIYEMLHALLQNGTSVLLTTHHLDEAQNRCGRIAIVDHGQIADSGTFDELVERTTGERQYVAIRFASTPQRLPPPLRLDASLRQAFGQIGDVGAELPHLLDDLQAFGAEIESVTLRGPTLQNVFLHLTGRELRE